MCSRIRKFIVDDLDGDFLRDSFELDGFSYLIEAGPRTRSIQLDYHSLDVLSVDDSIIIRFPDLLCEPFFRFLAEQGGSLGSSEKNLS